jgi:hypothetical protein
MPISNWSRYLRFSLASLLLVVTAVGVFLAPIVNRVRHQQRVIASVNKLGGQVHFVQEAKSRAEDPGWLRRWLGDDYFRTVRYINLQGHAATDDLVAGIVALGGLEEFNLGKTKITNDSLRHIAKLKNLKALDIGFNKITNDGLVHLGPLEELVHLDLDVTEITDEGLSALQKLPKLNRLQLFHTRVTDAGAETLSHFPALCELDVADTLITNHGVAHLAKLPGLTWLRLDQCSAGEGRELRINDVGLEHVARMPNLREVSLIQLNVTDEGLQRLKQTCPILVVRR